MPQYLSTIHLPDNYDPSQVDEAMVRDVEALGREMQAAGVREIFAGGLYPASSAKSLRAKPNGEVIVTDGPYLETKEHIGGVSIVECTDMDEVLGWARKGAVACRASGEVRAFQGSSVQGDAGSKGLPVGDKPQFLVAIHHPDNYDPSVEIGAIAEEIHALNREMIAAGARIFAGGLTPASEAKSLRRQPDGKVLVTDGPYLETKEHVGGFWILQAADLDEALAWARKAVVACRAPVEVRAIFFQPPTD